MKKDTKEKSCPVKKKTTESLPFRFHFSVCVCACVRVCVCVSNKNAEEIFMRDANAINLPHSQVILKSFSSHSQVILKSFSSHSQVILKSKRKLKISDWKLFGYIPLISTCYCVHGNIYFWNSSLLIFLFILSY